MTGTVPRLLKSNCESCGSHKTVDDLMTRIVQNMRNLEREKKKNVREAID